MKRFQEIKYEFFFSGLLSKNMPHFTWDGHISATKNKSNLHGHPKTSQIFTDHIMCCEKLSLKPFPCSYIKAFLLLNIKLFLNNTHISTLGHKTSSKFNRVLHSNMNNVALPNNRLFPEIFLRKIKWIFYDAKCNIISTIF